MQKITLIPGEGIGPEVIEAAVDCVEASGTKTSWETQEIRNGFLSPEVIASIKKNRVALKGPIATPIGKGFRSVNVQLREQLGLFAGVRPAKLFQGVKSPFKGADIVVIRENTEDLYAGIEFRKGSIEQKKLLGFLGKSLSISIASDSGISLKPISAKASRRITEFAFDYAKQNNRKKITVGHKANILKYSDGLFLETARKVAAKRKSTMFEDILLDHLCMQLVKKPQEFDVIVLPNLYGDIVSELCSGLVGGVGMVPGANIGRKYAVFETVHGTAPKYAGKNKANPCSAILSAALMLKHIGKTREGKKIEEAVAQVIKEGKHLTLDLKAKGRAAKTTEMTQTIIKKIEKMWDYG